MAKPFLMENVLANYMPIPEAGCWLWLGGWSTAGYGKCSRHSKVWAYAHRLFYSHFVGKIPDGMSVLHKCDTPACCNPSHLFVGTHADNIKDMWRKGRARPRGVLAQYQGGNSKSSIRRKKSVNAKAGAA